VVQLDHRPPVLVVQALQPSPWWLRRFLTDMISLFHSFVHYKSELPWFSLLQGWRAATPPLKQGKLRKQFWLIFRI
jgi:hypothetical protein